MTGQTPRIGAIGVTKAYNHVVYIEGISDTQVYVSEMNFYGFGGGLGIQSFRWAPISEFEYIY